MREGAGFEYIDWSVKQLARHQLKPREAVLLLVLGIRAGEDGVSWFATRTLAKQCSFSRDTLNQAIKGLESHRLLTHHRRAGTSSVYRLLKGGLTGTPDNPCPACERASRPAPLRDAAGRLTGPPVKHSNAENEGGLSGTPDIRLTGTPDMPMTGTPDSGLTGPPVTELPVELSKELQERTSTSRADAREGGPPSIEDQANARAWFQRHRETWGPASSNTSRCRCFTRRGRVDKCLRKPMSLYAQRFGLTHSTSALRKTPHEVLYL